MCDGRYVGTALSVLCGYVNSSSYLSNVCRKGGKEQEDNDSMHNLLQLSEGEEEGEFFVVSFFFWGGPK